MNNLKYNRLKAVEYAKRWAYKRNPMYYNFDEIGGDCTSFISQCIYEGSGIMNYTKNFGWYYINGNNKAPAWSGVEFLYNFITKNKLAGPYGKEVTIDEVELGDFVQLSFTGEKFEHSLLIVKIENKNDLSGIKIATHTFDAFEKPVSQYNFKEIRFVHIEGVRTRVNLGRFPIGHFDQSGTLLHFGG